MALIWKSRKSQGRICYEKFEVLVRDMKDSF